MNIPNAISLARIFIVPLCMWLILRDAMVPAFWVVVAAAVSDGLDGFIAKKFNSVTELGGFLDPIADKALLVSVFIALGVQGHIPLWMVILVVFRDLLIIGGAMLYQAITRALSMEPLMISKANTLAQLLFVVLVLGDTAFELSLGQLRNIGIVLVSITTFLSGAAYVWEWSRRAAEMEHALEDDSPGDEGDTST